MDLNRLKLSQIDTSDIASSEFASKSSVNIVQDNVAALDNNVWVNSNDYSTYTTVTGLINTVQSNVDALPDSAANDYSTYTTLSGLINTVQDNVSTVSSNTQVYVGDGLLSNTTLRLTAGDGLTISGNTTSGEATFTVSMSNVTSQTIALDGSANSFSIVKAVSNTNMVFVIYNGLVQDPSRYSIDSTTLTLANDEPIVAGANLELRYLDFFSLPGTSESGGGGYSFQGTVSGYTSGGRDVNASPQYQNTIDKFSFSSDGNATDVGDLTQVRGAAAGQSSASSGYTSGGYAPSDGGAFDTIDKFPFAADANATDVGNITSNRIRLTGQSSSDSGYVSGGASPYLDVIEKFPFSVDSNATDVGDLTQGRYFVTSQSSTTSGYTSGGNVSPGFTGVNTIDKFAFSADGNATDVGDLTQERLSSGGQSSTSSGYTSGGGLSGLSTFVNTIDKFPFASDTNATDVGDLTQVRRGPAGQSSTASGYSSGGSTPGPDVNTVDKFPFAADANATDVGDLTQLRREAAGQQV